MFLRIYALVLFLMSTLSVFAQNPCAEPHARALVMGGGGSKGGFEAGAVYHLVMHRGCDFDEISGTSAGALNGVVLAQARRSQDPAESLESMEKQADSLVQMWLSIRGSKDVVKGRPLATLRFGMFGLEAMKNFAPLQKLISQNLSPERLEMGRDFRVGPVSMYDGQYREVLVNPNGRADPNTTGYVLASAMIPMYGTLPRLPVQTSASTSGSVQFGDGSLRHMVPIGSYFVSCAAKMAVDPEACRNQRSNPPSHQRIEQIFVIGTSPIQRNRDYKPVTDNTALRPGTLQITDGRKLMSRSIDVIMDTIYRSDLNSMWLANDLLAWRADLLKEGDPTGKFPLESYNFDRDNPERPSRAYRIGVITPSRDESEMSKVLDFSTERISRQMFCGCVAADRMMQTEFGVDSMVSSCLEHFRPPNLKKKKLMPNSWDAGVCDEPPSSPLLAATGTLKSTEGSKRSRRD